MGWFSYDELLLMTRSKPERGWFLEIDVLNCRFRADDPSLFSSNCLWTSHQYDGASYLKRAASSILHVIIWMNHVLNLHCESSPFFWASNNSNNLAIKSDVIKIFGFHPL